MVSWLIRSDLGLAFFVASCLPIDFSVKRCQRSRLRQMELKNNSVLFFNSDIEPYIWDEINYGLLATAIDDYKKINEK